MKKGLVVSSLFLAMYLLFLVVLMPASTVLNWATLPSHITLGKVSGSIWHTKISSVKVNTLQFNNVESKLSVLSLFIMNPSIEVNFGDPLVTGPEGRGKVSGLLNELTLEQVNLSVSANTIVDKLQLPVPIVAHDFVDLQFDKFVIGKPVCTQLTGNILWNKAAVTALGEKVKLGKLSAKLSCEQGDAVLTIDPKNDLGLSFSASVGKGYRASGNGFLTPNDKMPESIKQVLPFLGKADNQGRYRLRF